jgi:hypothetical protein
VDVLTAAARQKAPDPEERDRAVAELATLMTARPARAAALGSVLQAALTAMTAVPEG